VNVIIALTPTLKYEVSDRSLGNSIKNWPMGWVPVANCPWSEGSSQIVEGRVDGGPVYSADQMRSLAYAGYVGSSAMFNLVFFDLFDGTEDSIVTGADRIAREALDLLPSFYSSFTTLQPIVKVDNKGGFIRARGYAEEIPGSDDICLNIITLNIDNSFQEFAVSIDYTGMPSLINATLPFEGNQDRTVQIMNGLFYDTLAPRSVNVYRVGCTVPSPDPSNVTPNPSFESPSFDGGVTAWSGGRAGWWAHDGHDLRSRLALSSQRPQHGRYSLRFTVPTSETLTTMWGMACDTECGYGSNGILLNPKTNYTLAFWARSDHGVEGMSVAANIGYWNITGGVSNGFHQNGYYTMTDTVAKDEIDSEWRLLKGFIKPASEKRYLQLQFFNGPGHIYIDNTYLGAGLTQVEATHVYASLMFNATREQ